MKILVNGAWRETQHAELGRALEELGYGASVVSTGRCCKPRVTDGVRLTDASSIHPVTEVVRLKRRYARLCAY